MFSYAVDNQSRRQKKLLTQKNDVEQTNRKRERKEGRKIGRSKDSTWFVLIQKSCRTNILMTLIDVLLNQCELLRVGRAIRS